MTDTRRPVVCESDSYSVCFCPLTKHGSVTDSRTNRELLLNFVDRFINPNGP